jgi:hypothetical protein
VVSRDPGLFNQYAVTLGNPTRHPEVKAALSMAFINWQLTAGSRRNRQLQNRWRAAVFP